MGFTQLLEHKCDIYHIRQEDVSPGYGLQTSPSFSYPEEPDLAGVSCHFGAKGVNMMKGGNTAVAQKEPYSEYEVKIKLALEYGTDIRVNDKVVDCGDGYEYTAGVPRNVRDHHTMVYLQRTARQKPL